MNCGAGVASNTHPPPDQRGHTNDQDEDTMVQQAVPENTPFWETVYVFWMWMTALSLMPFDCKVFVSTDVPVSFIDRLLHTCHAHLSDAEPIRTVATSCLAAWLSRPDLEQQTQISIVVTQSIDMQEQCSHIARASNSTNMFHVLGVLQTLVAILKLSSIPRETLLQHMMPLWDPILHLSDHSPNGGGLE
jgi:hypothetical protein